MALYDALREMAEERERRFRHFAIEVLLDVELPDDEPCEGPTMEQMTPFLENIPINEMAIDATPDGRYALRLLEAYRRRCECVWNVSGLDEHRTALYDHMNRDQQKRAEELDAAIALLRGAGG
jgi:hypothetical protein